ncbi:uncharacterized protein LOC125034436 isoform X3 [Penaeus chinensis]|uniref:uncharacterized protein LOC125034436 isoform X3 n=1 Tax=Penaeus chinensis TaxID=139456 RepID=UPI001FB71A1B|nr:uncharacterized protein LOC125034436 isoform X3 [Penaeus chinensis]
MTSPSQPTTPTPPSTPTSPARTTTPGYRLRPSTEASSPAHLLSSPARPACPARAPEARRRPAMSTRRSTPMWACLTASPRRPLHRPFRPPHPSRPSRLPTGRGVRRQMSEDRARSRRNEEELRRQPRRQRSEDARLRHDDISSSSGDLMTLDVRDMSKPRPTRDSSRGRSREPQREAREPQRDAREPRHLRKSRSGEVEARKVAEQAQERGRRRRSRSSDRWLDHAAHPDPLMEQRLMEAGMMDPRMIDPRLIDPRMIDPRMIDPRMIDPRYMDEPFPMAQDPIRFPHLMSYPPMTQAGPLTPGNMSPGAISPIPPGPPMGPPFLPMEYPPYPMYPYDVGYIPDLMLPPHHPAFAADHIPPEFMRPEYLPPDYPLDFPLEYGPAPHPGMMGGMWAGPRPRDDWPPPTPQQAQQMIQRVVRNPSRSSGDDDKDAAEGVPKQTQLQPGVRRTGRRLTSAGHSDSSGLSSPSEDRRPLNRKPPGYRGANQSFRESSEFRVGEAVRELSPRGPIKNSTSLPHFSSGKDSGFDETPPIGDEFATSRGGRSGGAFIVSGVFNDSSRMFIPAPPSPTPDYDDDGESDGNESDILQGSQFYVVTDQQGEPVKKKLTNRDSLSDDSLQNAPVTTKSTSKSSTPPKTPSTPLQSMMRAFHKGLPDLEQENGFSDDSLEDSVTAQSRPSTISQKPHRPTSMESLVSMESSTASFDYMNAGQAKNSSYGRARSRPNSAETGAQKGGNVRDRKDLNGKVKKSTPRSAENGIGQKGNLSNKDSEKNIEESNNFSRQSSRESSHSSGSTSSKPSEKFDTIRHMLKEGLIEGLDESPPTFKPPPPIKKTPNGVHTEDRADSGLGSAVSTTRTDESGGSDNRSDFSGTPPSILSPQDGDATKKGRPETKRGKETVRSRTSIGSEDMERNRDEGDEVEVMMQETMEIPPPPPPRDESMHWTPRTTTPLSQKDSARSSLRATPTTPSTSKNSSWLHNATKEEMVEISSANSPLPPGEKITHVDDLYGQHEHVGNGNEVSSAINGSLASQYSIQDNDNPLTDRDFLENLKNLEPRPRPDTLAVISEDQGSIGSKSSRSGRLLSRLADSVRSGSRTPTPSSSNSSTTRATTTKLTSTSRSSTRIHGDIIRDPWRSSLRESALPSPQEYARLPSLSPSVVPLTRDGSGRFRSIEDLAEAVSEPTQQEVTLTGKKKKHSTLPPNLTPADMKKENKELRRATSLMVGKKGKER